MLLLCLSYNPSSRSEIIKYGDETSDIISTDASFGTINYKPLDKVERRARRFEV